TYCDRRRAYFVAFPKSLFQELNFLTDFRLDSFVSTQVLLQLGSDLQQYTVSHRLANEEISSEIKPTVTTFYTKLAMFRDRIPRHDFSCLSQVSNHLPGRQGVNWDTVVTESLAKYAKGLVDRPQCFSFGKVFPETYFLYKKQDCQEFFKILDSARYQETKKRRTFVYMKKLAIGEQIGTGGEPVNDFAEEELRKLYDRGNYCGTAQYKYLIQRYIHDPLQFGNQRVDFRMFMLVASLNPLIVYYHDGFLQMNGMQSDLQSFSSYLLTKGVLNDPQWLNNYLRPEFKKAMIHLLRAGVITPLEDSSVYQLYAIDFILDSKLDVWFVKANPAMDLSNLKESSTERLIAKLLADEIEIVMGLLRSRMKRVIKFVNELLRDGLVQENKDGEVKIRDLELKRIIFQKITENYFEKEFNPQKTNGFQKIFDANHKGWAKYGGLVNYECL
ncbi:MAG: hypothetical protein ACQUHE_16495, partial [Bacteroidia bacterium]